ncbi:MAG TPA: PIN domain-containing protein [Rubrivivax sp.]|nr:PIN domain-containing protein [Rubrivivax sp.]
MNTSGSAIVLDTNVVLDWLLFRDTRVAALGAALESAQLRWMACSRMREEFRHTLARPLLGKWNPDSGRLLTLFDRHATLLPEPGSAPLRLRCDDADDQVFIDLALACGARWLLSHDKALLRLRRRVPPGGPQICRPSDWQALFAPKE